MNMIGLRVPFPAFCTICLALISGTAAAQDQPRTMLASDRLYVGIAVGPIVPEDMNVHLSGTISGSGRLLFNPAGVVGGFVGYKASDRLAAEFEIDWSLYDPYSLTGSFVGPSGAFAGLALDGNFDTVLGLANVIYRPLGEKGRFVPYLGAGAGFADIDWSVMSRPGSAIALDVRGSAFDFAADVGAGIDYALTDRITLGGRYRYLWIDSSGGSLTGGGVTLVHGDVHAHLFTATARYRF
jgi:opacity protein-like surface antigen